MVKDNNIPQTCEQTCQCRGHDGPTRLIVLTGGPGAGKTAVLEIVMKQLCEHVAILPEAASIIFGGGFWRMESKTGKMAAQRAIMYVQREMENLVLDEKKWSTGLCDRGLADGLAYWPNDEGDYWRALGISKEQVYDRYYSVIHLRTPDANSGYNHQNHLRIETAEEAAQIDEKIHNIWKKHPKYHMVETEAEFMIKAKKTIDFIREDLPECCRIPLFS